MAKNEAAETETQDSGDAPLIDLNDASIKKLIARAKKRGFITYDELNEALPQDQMSSEQIEDVMSAISEMGVNIVENEEASDDDEKEEDTTEDEVDPLRQVQGLRFFVFRVDGGERFPAFFLPRAADGPDGQAIGLAVGRGGVLDLAGARSAKFEITMQSFEQRRQATEQEPGIIRR